MSIESYQPRSADAADSERGRASRASRAIIWIAVLALGSFVGWAAYAEIDQVTRAPGQIVASSRTQVIQSSDGGVLVQMLVKEGQAVERGQVLARLDKTKPEAAFLETRARRSTQGAGGAAARRGAGPPAKVCARAAPPSGVHREPGRAVSQAARGAGRGGGGADALARSRAARVRHEPAAAGDGRRLALQPGMTSTIEIRTGSNTVLRYLSKPLVKTLDESMGER